MIPQVSKHNYLYTFILFGVKSDIIRINFLGSNLDSMNKTGETFVENTGQLVDAACRATKIAKRY